MEQSRFLEDVDARVAETTIFEHQASVLSYDSPYKTTPSPPSTRRSADMLTHVTRFQRSNKAVGMQDIADFSACVLRLIVIDVGHPHRDWPGPVSHFMLSLKSLTH